MVMAATTDLETLSLRTNAVILSAGLVVFDMDKVDSFKTLLSQGTNIYVDQDIQLSEGRLKDAATIAWWEKQGEAAAECLNNPNQVHPKMLGKLMSDFAHRYVEKAHKLRYFCRGPQFDIAKLEDLFFQFETTPPWHYRKPRCSRTALDVYGYEDDVKFVRPSAMIPHNSLHDAAFEAYLIQRARNGHPIEIEPKDK